MRQTIRALGWLIAILWIVTLLLPVTVIFSLSNLLAPNTVGFREPNYSLSNTVFSMSAPFYVNNTGFYDLSEINTTVVLRNDNRIVATSSNLLPNVPAGTTVDSAYEFSFDLQEIASNHNELLINDADLDLDISLSFRVAYVITFGLATDFTTQWKAPFYNLTVTDSHYNSTTEKFSINMSFTNHAYFTIDGPLLIEIYNNRSETISTIGKNISVPPSTSFQELFESTIIPSAMTDNGTVHIYFAGVQVSQKEWNLNG